MKYFFIKTHHYSEPNYKLSKSDSLRILLHHSSYYTNLNYLKTLVKGMGYCTHIWTLIVHFAVAVVYMNYWST